jgi:hypothetical protein
LISGFLGSSFSGFSTFSTFGGSYFGGAVTDVFAVVGAFIPVDGAGLTAVGLAGVSFGASVYLFAIAIDGFFSPNVG